MGSFLKLEERFRRLESKKLSHRSLKRHIWDICSFIGNLFFRKYPPDIKDENGMRYLNLGAGEVIKDGFVNADFYRLHKIFVLPKTYWMLDLTKPIKCKDNWWDGIHLEHVNEHLHYLHNLELLKEIYRTLKPGGTLRICLPDLDKYLDWNKIKNYDKKMSRYASLAEAISNLTQNHLHLSIWNFSLFKEVLETIGFVEVNKRKFGDSSIKTFTDAPNHKWQSLYIEAKKI